MNGVLAGAIVLGLFVVVPLAIAAVIVATRMRWRDPALSSQPIGGNAPRAMLILGVFAVGYNLGVAVSSDRVEWLYLGVGLLFVIVGWYLVRQHGRLMSERDQRNG